MKIIVKESNFDKIKQAIKVAEGRATARTICASDIFTAVQYIEQYLDIPKKLLLGVKAQVDYNAQNFPNAYKYIPESTHFELERVASGWAVTAIYRGRCGGPKSTYHLKLTEEAKAAIIQRCTWFE